MAATLLGIGTAQPAHSMSQEEALAMATRIMGQDERQNRLLRVMFRKAAVDNRQTVVPHRIAYDWIGAMEAEAEASHKVASTTVAGHLFEHASAPDTASASATVRTGDETVLDDSRGAAFGGPTTGERMQMYAEFAGPLALESSRAALRDAGIDPRRVTHLVTVSCTGFAAPGVDIELISNLDLRPDTQRLQIGFMGCHGAINGMRAAQAIVDSQSDAIVLLCTVELCSLHYRFNWDDDGMVGNALFADGSASLVIAGERTASPTGARDDANSNTWKIVATGSCVIPDSRHVMTWLVGDSGFEMRLTGEVGPKIEDHLQPWLTRWLDQFDLSVDAVDEWAVHPGGPKILAAVENSLRLPDDATAVSRDVLSSCGNMSSPTVLFILDRIRDKSAARSIVALGFGPGLVAEVALLQR